MKKTLASKIIDKRVECNLTQIIAAFKIGISISKLQQIEQGQDENSLSIETRERIAKWLNKT